MWTAIAVTCRNNQPSRILQRELDVLKEKGLFPSGIPVIVVEDPSEDIGSGGSTLNALLVIAEHISAKSKQTVLSVDVLQCSKILIVHLGDKFMFDPCGRAFLSLGSSVLTETDILVPVNPLIHLYKTLTEQLAPSLNHPGVWVVGSDAYFSLSKDFRISCNEEYESSDILVFSTPTEPGLAEGHGVYKLDKEGFIEDIVYQGRRESVLSCSINENNEVPLVIALLYMKVPVAESLLLLHSAFPLSCSTYLGIDSGGIGLKLSLFFDFLLPTCKRISYDDFIGGERAGSMGKAENSRCEQRIQQLQLMPIARKSLWEALKKYRTKAVVMETEFYHYFSEDKRAMERFVNHIEQQSHYATPGLPTGLGKVFRPQIGLEPKTVLNCTDLGFRFEEKRDKTLEDYWNLIENVLRTDQHTCILPLFRSLCVDKRQNELLSRLDELAATCGSSRTIGRTFSCIADVLGILAKGEGGLRSGPAANKEWKEAVCLLEKEDVEKGVKVLAEIRKQWMGSPSRLIRAARHYEAAAQIFIRKTVMGVQKFIRTVKEDCVTEASGWTKCEAAVRMDVAGGWSDTPPITYEHGGAVLNIAIKVDGKKPVGARCRTSAHPSVKIRLGSEDWTQELVFTRLDDIRCYSNPASPGSLVCAVLVCANLVDVNCCESLSDQLEKNAGGGVKGLEIECWSNLPQGSGLGTSSILAGCLLVAVWRASGHNFDTDALLHAILYVEQLLTTGGGWQDQVGGLVPGIKLGRFGNTTETARISYEKVEMNDERRKKLENQLLLVYTGRTRLAKNLLQEVIRNWYSRQRDIVETVSALVDNAEQARIAAETFDLVSLGLCASEYWKQKKRMAPGCEPKAVSDLLRALRGRDLIDAGWLAGAGGGGYLYLLTKQPNMKQAVVDVIEETVPNKGMSVHSVEIDMQPLILTLES